MQQFPAPDRAPGSLSALDALSHIPAELLESVESRLTTVRLAPGEVLCEEGTPSDGLFLVAEGRLTVSVRMSGEDRPVGVVEAGEVVGELQALSGGLRSATVRADGPAVAIAVPTEVLR
jgi:CRP-like cAMP-binding protein